MSMNRLGTAITPPDDNGRTAHFGILAISDDAETLTVRYEATCDAAGIVMLVPGPTLHAQIVLPRSVFGAVKYTRYFGDENATVDRVVHYLLTNYTDKHGRPLTPAYLRSVVNGNPDVIKAEQLSSFAYYPGNKIADALDFDPVDDTEVDNPGELD